jgi:hypothetical protein
MKMLMIDPPRPAARSRLMAPTITCMKKISLEDDGQHLVDFGFAGLFEWRILPGGRSIHGDIDRAILRQHRVGNA